MQGRQGSCSSSSSGKGDTKRPSRSPVTSCQNSQGQAQAASSPMTRLLRSWSPRGRSGAGAWRLIPGTRWRRRREEEGSQARAPTGRCWAPALARMPSCSGRASRSWRPGPPRAAPSRSARPWTTAWAPTPPPSSSIAAQQPATCRAFWSSTAPKAGWGGARAGGTWVAMATRTVGGASHS